nr:asparagine synthase (glutamine-hydrolyzing) [uncultured Albidiferax sp.]
MCGILFVRQGPNRPVQTSSFEAALRSQRWRGPDAEGICALESGEILLGHNRLAIIDPSPRSNQPLRSACGRYIIIFNGEIYNHATLRSGLQWEFKTESDSETLLAGLALQGEYFLRKLDGMFAFVFLDSVSKQWIAARDDFGIKPLFIHRNGLLTIIGSEAPAIRDLINASPSEASIEEWRLIRRPIPGKSFFEGIEEILPGTYVKSNNESRKYRERSRRAIFSQEEFEEKIIASVKAHELSDVPVTAFLSGGLDSAVICALSSVTTVHTIGMACNNEFDGATENAVIAGKSIKYHEFTPQELIQSWEDLVKIRREPISVPNEGLIYMACRNLPIETKVILTGEGADELLFGYDRLFRWAVGNNWQGMKDFLDRYGYSGKHPMTERLASYLEEMKAKKSVVEFAEDFFLDVHLPGLLRRMDSATMAASREARVPFVCTSLMDYMYRQPAEIRLSATESKIPLRRFAKKLSLFGALERKKIGFSANVRQVDRKAEYDDFQTIIMKELGWL